MSWCVDHILSGTGIKYYLLKESKKSAKFSVVEVTVTWASKKSSSHLTDCVDLEQVIGLSGF